MLSRRAMVGRLAAGTVAACTVGAARVTFGSTQGDTNSAGEKTTQTAEKIALVDGEPPATQSAPGPWELLSPLTAGATVGYGWRATALSAVTNGSCVLTLENDRGRTHRVHLCSNNGQPQGLVFTNHLDLVVMNGGQGDLPTDEGFAQAVAEVAHLLASNEGRRPEVVAALLPHAERVSRFDAAQLR
jgi:hypothetical protein